MKPSKEEIEKAAKEWRQTELEKRGDHFWYKPRTVTAAFADGAKWALEKIEGDLEWKKSHGFFYSEAPYSGLQKTPILEFPATKQPGTEDPSTSEPDPEAA